MTQARNSVARRSKTRVTLTLEPGLLSAVDRYVQEHHAEGVDRSGVVAAALRLWYHERLREAMRAQFLALPSEEEIAEQEAWARIRAAAGEEFVRRFAERECR
jgi:metal-responsive CopG/Arc/MetJ family transcriptional regulator